MPAVDFIAIARERLANNGRNPANKNAGIRVGSDLHICQELLAEIDRLRELVTYLLDNNPCRHTPSPPNYLQWHV